MLSLARGVEGRIAAVSQALGQVVAAIVFAAIVSFPAGSQTQAFLDAAATPRKGERTLDWPSQESDLTPDPNVRYGRLANGMRYAIRSNATPTKTVSIRMRFNVGSLMEADDQQGLAHFLEHMAFNGSENVPEGEMTRLLQRHGLSFGAHTNAYTGFDETVYKLDAPNVEEATLRTTFSLMRELASKLAITPDAVDRERGVILSEERARNTPAYRAADARWRALLPHALFSKRSPIGIVDVIRNAPAQRLRDFYESYYRPERAFFVVVGDLDIDATEVRIREMFADWKPARPDPGDPDLGSIAGGAEAAYFHDPHSPTAVSVTTLREPVREANTSASVQRSLLRRIGNAIVSRRLETLARAPGAPLHGGQASGAEMLDTVDVSAVDLASQPGDWERALTIAEQELRRAVEHGFTQAEISEEIARNRTFFRTAAVQASTRSSSGLADEIVGEFSNWGVDMAPGDELAAFERIAPSMTPDAVHQAFRAQWDGLSPHVFLSSSQEIDNFRQRARNAIDAGRRHGTAVAAEAAAPGFAYTDFGPSGAVVERSVIEDLGITTIRFANNVRLNIKPTKFAADSVLVSVRFGGGILELPADKPGLGFLVGATTGGGLQAHSSEELQRILAGRNVGVRVGVVPNAFSFDGRTTPEDLELQLQLMTAYLVAPGYRDEGLVQFRQGIRSETRTLDGTPNGVAQRDVPRLVRSGDRRYGIPPEEETLARNFDEVRQALLRASRSGGIEIGMVGDVDIARATELVAKTFGALPVRSASEPPFDEARSISFPAATPSPVVLNHSGEANRAMALVFWPTLDDSDAQAMRTLELLRSVLSLKLIERVRETDGATYAPSTEALFAHANPGYGYIGISLDLAPVDVDRFFPVLDEIAADLAGGQISEDELARARRPIVDQFRNDQESNAYWLSLVTTAQSDQVALSRHRRTATDYQAVAVRDLAAAAQRYLRQDRAYRIAIYPAKH
ncbi:M16 family metallopeptidase [Pseudoxanthomonas sacheonensis]|uniref:Zinc protease n=1 Tax=Pseudoxanthomonas sacheonensis TaxID=443615 RepID=A0ABU1RRT0_9GAMM|nr:insulinase family protein [Pseudoxanthomonas sacheonensis]MDR6841302.1 zinc protease [Pseudoxanthomonas sacheonensis]